MNFFFKNWSCPLFQPPCRCGLEQTVPVQFVFIEVGCQFGFALPYYNCNIEQISHTAQPQYLFRSIHLDWTLRFGVVTFIVGGDNEQYYYILTVYGKLTGQDPILAICLSFFVQKMCGLLLIAYIAMLSPMSQIQK